MDFEEWLALRKARDTIEKVMDAFVKQIRDLPERDLVRSVLEAALKNLIDAWMALADRISPPPGNVGPMIGPAPVTSPHPGMSPEEYREWREQMEHLQHAMWELFEAAKRARR
jgi:hypothetical protein